MSEIHDILADVISERAPTFANQIVNLTSGVPFTAEIETNLDPFTLPESLANDPREKVRLHVTSLAEAQAQNETDIVSFVFNGRTVKAKLVSGAPELGNLQSRFYAKIGVPGKDDWAT